jgi:hypothetical protein
MKLLPLRKKLELCISGVLFSHKKVLPMKVAFFKLFIFPWGSLQFFVCVHAVKNNKNTRQNEAPAIEEKT